jgi:hypothetical protein
MVVKARRGVLLPLCLALPPHTRTISVKVNRDRFFFRMERRAALTPNQGSSRGYTQKKPGRAPGASRAGAPLRLIFPIFFSLLGLLGLLFFLSYSANFSFLTLLTRLTFLTQLTLLTQITFLSLLGLLCCLCKLTGFTYPLFISLGFLLILPLSSLNYFVIL